MNESDQDIWLKIKKGDELAFRQLFDEHYPSLCWISNRLVQNKEVAKDIAQDVFVALWNRRSTLQINVSIFGYLKRATINKSLNYIKANSKVVPLDGIKQNKKDDVIESSHSDLEREEIVKIVQQKIKALPGRCQEIFVLRRYEDMSYREIAKTLNISERTVEVQLRKARMMLKEELKPYIHYLTCLFLIIMG